MDEANINDQYWFWTKRWQEMEREVDWHLARGEATTHASLDELSAYLERLDDSAEPKPREAA